MENNTSKHEKVCEGDCIKIYGEHKGEVKRYMVSGNYFPDMEFNYCDNAVKEDIRRGFDVVQIDVRKKYIL